jgi:hypothetical protein
MNTQRKQQIDVLEVGIAYFRQNIGTVSSNADARPKSGVLPELGRDDVRMTGTSANHLGFQNRLHIHVAPVLWCAGRQFFHENGRIDEFAGALRRSCSKARDHDHFSVCHTCLKTSDYGVVTIDGAHWLSQIQHPRRALLILLIDNLQ